jgi:hypothetical protein
MEWRPRDPKRPTIREMIQGTPAEWLASVVYTVLLLIGLTVLTELLR